MPLFNRYLNLPAVPSSVSRDLTPADYSWDTVVYQAGRPILDAELNLAQDASEYNRVLLSGSVLPSGFIRRQGITSALGDYGFSPAFPADTFALSRLLANVAGMPVVVEYTNTTTAGQNFITLPPADPSSGAPPDIKRTDFVFLEVWRAQVAPSPRAFGTVQIGNAPFSISAGDTVTINTGAIGGPTVTFTAVVGVPGANQFQIGANADVTGINLAAAINASALYPNFAVANAHSSSIVQVTAGEGGVAGNGVTLARVEAVAGSIVLSAPTLLNGADRPNKPTQDTIYHHGNVDSPTGVDLPDNLVDPALNVESTQRVQVQYRFRVYGDVLLGVDPKTQPDGFSNISVLAQGATGAPVAGYPFVPADNSTVLLNSDATAYGFVDGGLYVAGDGSSASATALGTADGFVYAIPVCFVFRRNDASLTGGFNPAGNANGALSVTHAGFNNTHLDGAGPVAIAANLSDRPDGLFHDVIAAEDILDLRRHVTPPGYDYASELKNQTQSLLDATNLTWQVESSDMGIIGSGSGGQSTTPMVCDEIARAGDPSANVFGDRIRGFDHIARRFGSQPVVERVIFEVLPNAGPYPPGFAVTNAAGNGWTEGDTVTLDFGALRTSSLQNWTAAPAANTVAGTWPFGTRVTDVLVSYHDDGHSTAPVDQTIQFKSIVGIGTDIVTMTLDANPQVIDVAGSGTELVDTAPGGNGSRRRLFIELEVTYPTGAGLTRTPRAELTPDTGTGYAPYNGGAIVQFDATQRPPEMNATWVPNPKFRVPFREVLLEQKSNSITDTIVTRFQNQVYTPRRIQTNVGLTVNGVPTPTGSLGSSDRKITIAPAAGQQVPVVVVYTPQDPIPDAGTGYRLDVYYQTTAPQTCGVQAGAVPTTLLPEGLVLEPLSVSNHIWTGQTSAGSAELAFPYATPLDPIPTPNVAMGFPREWYFAATATVSVSDFNAATGSLTLHSMVPMDGSNLMTLGNAVAGRGTAIDAEFRAFYDYVNHLGYKPTAMTQPLSGAVRHKVFTTMLARVNPAVLSLLFRPSELVLVVFSRFAILDADNKIIVADPVVGVPTSVVAVYRTKNLLLSAGN